MTRPRTLSAMLAVTAALFAVDIALRVSPREAAAQEPEIRLFPEPPVRIIDITATWSKDFRRERLYRVWSDGVIEENRRRAEVPNPEWRGWEAVPEVPAP